MTILQELYEEIKNIISEYEKTLELDKYYMNIFLNDNNEKFSNNNLNNEIDLNNDLNSGLNDEYVEINKQITIDRKCINLYRKLAKILHPDKNGLKNIDDFIKMSNAYKKNDYITLFMYAYNFNIEISLNSEEIECIKREIIEKKNKIEEIKSKIHWQWNMCSNDLEREILREHINEI